MPIRSLAEVGARLEAVAALPGRVADSAEIYERYEMVAIQILDSEHGDFDQGALQDYLRGYLALKRMELGLPACQ